MLLRDARGEPMEAGDARSAGRLEDALADVLGFRGDPIGRIDAALADDPGFALGHLLRAHLYLFALQPGFRAKAEPSLAAARALEPASGERERLHRAAAEAWARGELAAACAAFDALLARHPRDLLALVFAHQADFFSGRVDALRARPERALAAWGEDGLPGRGFVEGMLAFGLEENGAYAAAERVGRRAVERSPRDVWAIHAVGHVLEMQGRDAEGIAWYGAREADWAEGSFFAVHNAWHLALYHVDRDDAAAALAVHDRLVCPGPRSILLNLCDAAALLWRLRLAGVDAGEARWGALADLAEPLAAERVHVFDDVHLAIAFAGAGRDRALDGLLAALAAAAAAGSGERARATVLVGLPAARAMAALARGDAAEAVDLLLTVRPNAALMTGSRAQRDVLELTLVEAAIRAGRTGLAADLLERRLAAKPGSRRIRRDLARCGRRPA